MSNWRQDELEKIASTDDLHVAPFRGDGVTYGTPTWVWSVAVSDRLYVRAYNGPSSSWYQAAMRQRSGRITAAGLWKEVSFEPGDTAVQEQIDQAYGQKYKSSPYLQAMLGAGARVATVRIVPK